MLFVGVRLLFCMDGWKTKVVKQRIKRVAIGKPFRKRFRKPIKPVDVVSSKLARWWVGMKKWAGDFIPHPVVAAQSKKLHEVGVIRTSNPNCLSCVEGLQHSAVAFAAFHPLAGTRHSREHGSPKPK